MKRMKGQRDVTLQEWKVDNVKVEIITFVIQLRVESVVLTYDECQVQVICLVIKPIRLFNI